MKKILFILGTRPEAIKLSPVIFAFSNHSKYEVLVCSTGQHAELLSSTLRTLNIVPDINLEVMSDNQTLAKLTEKCISTLTNIISIEKPDLLFVQGDTTTAYCGALVGFYNQIKVAHVEAGLRSGDIYAPFPEEINRKMISNLSTYHFTPTIRSTKNLAREGYTSGIYQVGNTVVDALNKMGEAISDGMEPQIKAKIPTCNFTGKLVLVTGHRRENFGAPLINICEALLEISNDETVDIIYPVHPNPNVQNKVNKLLNGKKNIHLTTPLAYDEFIWLMNKCSLIITDSGGIQEEAVSLKKPVIITREVTERMELIDSGWGILAGHDKKLIVNQAKLLLTDENFYKKIVDSDNPFGDGTAAQKILKVISDTLNE
ncbi:MAG: UDP-N-acetylglucosamine 2-epimerase (non-hydrolyzing) [Flavobacteriales bacterium]|nr:UDP-N-acetylglucosamine 2-epimerase (non-hydrolyzing) [Flavobacteriales bacterium]